MYEASIITKKNRRLFSVASGLQVSALSQMSAAGNSLAVASKIADVMVSRAEARLAAGLDPRNENIWEIYTYRFQVINGELTLRGKYVPRELTLMELEFGKYVLSGVGAELRMFPIDEGIAQVFGKADHLFNRD